MMIGCVSTIWESVGDAAGLRADASRAYNTTELITRKVERHELERSEQPAGRSNIDGIVF